MGQQHAGVRRCPARHDAAASVNAVRTRLTVVLLGLLLLAGAGVIRASGPTHSSTVVEPGVAGLARASAPTGSQTSSQASSQAGTRAANRCRGLQRAEIHGDEPTYTHKLLALFDNHRRLCHGIWLPNPRRYLVPQGLAIAGRTAWLSGFRYRRGYGQRPCQLVRVDIVTGRRLAFHTAIFGRVGERPRTYCRHGGGIVQRGRQLWLVEKHKLWLVDPAQHSPVLNARRVWRIKAPVRGSAIVANSERIGLVPYQTRGVARIYWFSLKRLLQPGVLDLALRHDGTTQLGPIGSTRIPRYVQGATLDAGGRLYLSRSNLSCAELVTPYGRRIAFMPGAEAIQFASLGRRLWTVSESGAWPYAISRKPLTPALSSFEWPRLFRGKPAGCGFSAY